MRTFLYKDLIYNYQIRLPECVEFVKTQLQTENAKLEILNGEKYLTIDETLLPICFQKKTSQMNDSGNVPCATCGNKTDIMSEKLQEAGIQWGDAISWVTKKLGIPECKGCAVRKEIMNNVSKLGWNEALKQIKDTIID